METGGAKNQDLGQTLKEKLKAHYETRDKIFDGPGYDKAGKIGATFLWCFTTLLVGICMFVLFPDLYPDSYTRMTAFLLFLYAEIGVNWLLAARMKPTVYSRQDSKGSAAATTNGNAMPTSSKDWTYCLYCQQDAPPRSHHCKVCQACILKRDHHCFFTNSCIGFYNQKYFIVHLFYVAVGTACCIYWLGAYLDKTVPFLSSNIVAYIPLVQIIMYFTGTITLLDTFLIIVLYLAIFCFVTGFGFYLWEMVIILNAQTSYEAWKLIRKYKTGSILTRLRRVFGPLWLLNFLVPLPFTLEGDGLHFEQSTNRR